MSSPSSTAAPPRRVRVYDDEEECDDGNYIKTDACVDCAAAVCGETHVQDGVEDCDDANGDETDACSDDAEFQPVEAIAL